MIYRTTRKEEQEYRANEAISQSQLKLLLKGVHLFNNVEDPSEDYYKEKSHFIIGSAVDTMLTMGKEVCQEEYYISQCEKKPGDSIMSVIKEVYDTQYPLINDLSCEHFSSPWLKDYIIAIAENQGYQGNWKAETKYNKIISKGQDYWNDLVQSHGKQVLSMDQFLLIKSIYTSLLEHSHTAKYFELGNSNRYEIFYQLPLYFNYLGIDCKGLLDFCIVDHNLKDITPVDIKTMGDYVMNFPVSMFKRRYDIQAAFYTEALQRDHAFIEAYNLEGYTVQPFKFMVESTIAPGNPLVFTCTDEILRRGKTGIDSYQLAGHHLRKVDGFHQAIELYKWHLDNGFETDKVVAENSGDLKLGLGGVVG